MMSFLPRRVDAVEAGVRTMAAVWPIWMETRRAWTALLMYVNYFPSCFHTCFMVFTRVFLLWFSGSHIFIQRRWFCTYWPHTGSHFPARTNGKQHIVLSIKIHSSEKTKPKTNKMLLCLFIACTMHTVTLHYSSIYYLFLFMYKSLSQIPVMWILFTCTAINTFLILIDIEC